MSRPAASLGLMRMIEAVPDRLDGSPRQLRRFWSDELDSNIVERAIRPQTITRKNSLFAASDGGGRTWATIATLLQTAKMNNVDPQACSPRPLSASPTAGLAAISMHSCHETRSLNGLSSPLTSLAQLAGPLRGAAGYLFLECRGPDQAFAATGRRNGAPSRLKAFIAAMVIVRSTRSLGSKAAAAAA